jgi:transposase
MSKNKPGKRGRAPIIVSRTKLREILAFKKANKLSNVDTAKHFGFGVNTLYNTINRYKEE